ncbi:MAG: class I SAM-dependent methyltransferase [Anaeromyxobacter sp.]
MRTSRATPAGYPPGHFYSPVPDFEEVRRRAPALFDRSRRTVEGIDLREDAQLALVPELVACLRDQPFTDQPEGGRRYGFRNEAFCAVDALTLHCFLRRHRPRRVVEVGSGHSSAMMLDTDELFLGRATSLTFVEPFPDVLRAVVRPGDLERATLLQQPVQDVPLAPFQALEAGDVLFIDSSHVSKIGSDVNHLFFRVLPALAPGVLVHVHDIFFPFEYPEQWVLSGGCAWNEAYLLRAFLQFNPAFEVLFWGHFLWTFHAERLSAELPRFADNPGASLWLRRR